MVSIHAIATFQALHDYLRPRVSGLLSGGSRLSGMLAALAASGFGPGSSQAAAEELRQPSATLPAPAEGDAQTPSSASGIARRRSQRLNAKKTSSSAESSVEALAASEAGPSDAVVSNALILEPPVPHAGASSTETAPSETLAHDSGFAADFTDDEVDAEARFHFISGRRFH